MKRNLATLVMMCVCPAMIWAQKITVSGVVEDGSTEESMPGATVALLTPKDSARAAAVTTDVDGKFKLPSVKDGTYIMRVSFVGYRTVYKNLTLTKKTPDINMGTISIYEDSKLMQEAEVVGKLSQMEMKADTFVYNADAFRMPEGSTLEELVKKLPGAEVDDDGNIKINGKSVTRILVEGKDFFEGDTKMTTKNLTSKMIKKLKAYDKKSDYTRITGIEDGEEQTVLDLTLQKGMKEGWIINTNVGYGSEDRYSGQAMISRFMDNFQFALIGSSNNVNDRGFPGGGGRGGFGGGGGVVSSQMAGANFSWQNDKPDYSAGLLKVGGNVSFNHRRSSSLSRTNSEMFLDNVNSTFSNNMNHSINSNSNVNSRFRFEWFPDSATSIIFNPSFSHSESHGHSESMSVTFNQDPYEYMENPLEDYLKPEYKDVRDSIAVNDQVRTSKNNGNGTNVDGRLQVNRRLGKPGRNLTFDGGGSYSENENTQFSRNEINYYQQHRTDFTNQYIPSPTTRYDGRARLSYTEPILGPLNLQASYQFQYSYDDNDRSMYSIDSLLTKFPGQYTAEQLYLGYIPGLDSLEYIRNLENSVYSTYRTYNQDASLMLRFMDGGNLLSLGVNFQPQTTHLDYERNLLDTTVVRHTFNWAPRIDYRWKYNTGEIRLRFNGRMQQPNITSLLEVVDNSDPLYISTGNAGLRSSWQNDFNVFYNNYIPTLQMGWSVNASFNQTKNSISNATIYNTETGTRYSRPMNINGNWGSWGNLNFNSALGAKKLFNINNGINLNYNHNVGYMSSNSDGSSWGNIYNPDGSVNMDRIFRNTPLTKSVTKNTNVGEWMRLNYRNDIMEIGVNGGFNYSHARNDIQQNANMDTWSFNYGGNVVINAPWGTSFSSDISQQSRRGYDDASMNTNELIWNAQISQNFLKGKAATVSVQWFDILRERSNISRNISAFQRTDSWNNAIHSYVMVRFMYRLNLMGSRQARNDMGPGGWGGGRR